MPMKTERITILATPDFKLFLGSEAKKQGVSVSELVRSRCAGEQANKDDELLLQSLIEQVNESTKRAESSLRNGLEVAGQVLQELREARG